MNMDLQLQTEFIVFSLDCFLFVCFISLLSAEDSGLLVLIFHYAMLISSNPNPNKHRKVATHLKCKGSMVGWF